MAAQCAEPVGDGARTPLFQEVRFSADARPCELAAKGGRRKRFSRLAEEMREGDREPLVRDTKGEFRDGERDARYFVYDHDAGTLAAAV
jgi:hypothetical protein